MRDEDYLLLFASNQIVKHLRKRRQRSRFKRKADSLPASKAVLNVTGPDP